MKLEDFFAQKKKDVPLMLDESYFPEKGTVVMSPERPEEMNVPLPGAKATPSGKVVAPIQGIQTSGSLKAAEPVSPKVEEIKKIFSPEPVMQAPAPVQPQVKQAAPIALPKVEAQGSWSDYLPALAPLITEALMGGNGKSAGESLGIAGKYLVDTVGEKKKRAQTLEDKLLEIEKSRAIASAKAEGKSKLATASNLVPIVKGDKVVYEWAGEAAGEEKPVDSKKGLTLEDRLLLQEKSQSFREEQERRRLQKEAGARFQTKLEADPVFKDYKQQATQSQRALELLSKGVGVADAGARTTFAKGIFGEVGNLAIQEQMAVSGSPALGQKWESLWKRYTEGTLGDQDRADMVEVATAIRENAPNILSKIANQKAVAEQKISGMDVSDVANALSKDVTSGKIMVKVIYQNRVKEIPIEKYPEAVRDWKAKLYTGKE